jgi:hypothetical protein
VRSRADKSAPTVIVFRNQRDALSHSPATVHISLLHRRRDISPQKKSDGAHLPQGGTRHGMHRPHDSHMIYRRGGYVAGLL